MFSINWTISNRAVAVFSIDEPQGVAEVLEDDSWKTGLADTFTTLQCHIGENWKNAAAETVLI